MPSGAGLLRTRVAHLGAYLAGVAIGERIFRSREIRPTPLGSALLVGREHVEATRWEVHRINEDRLNGISRFMIARSARGYGRPRLPRFFGRLWSHRGGESPPPA